MSGVRIFDPELLALGMTLPGFVERGKVIASLPNLGLLTLAGLTPKNWEVFYHEIDALKPGTAGRLLDEPADLCAISTLTARVEDAYRLADQVRAAGRKVAIGGLHASVLPDEAQAHADAVVVGEGEAVWLQVLEDAENGSLRSRYVAARSGQFEPWAIPRYDLLDPSRYNRITLQTTRGCPLDCSFCGASRLISPYKRKAIHRIRAELEAIQAIWPRPFIELADDNTFVHRAWSRELVGLLREHRVKWFTETDVSVAEDLDLLDELAESGCAQLLIGLESVDKPPLAEADTKGWKRKRLEQYREAINQIQSRGISVNGCFVFGFDEHGPGVFDRTLEFVRTSGLSEVQITILTPFPGTALERRLRSKGRLLEDRFWPKCTLFDVTFRPAKMTAEELQSGFREMARELYSLKETERRKAMFRECVRVRHRARVGD